MDRMTLLSRPRVTVDLGDASTREAVGKQLLDMIETWKTDDLQRGGRAVIDGWPTAVRLSWNGGACVTQSTEDHFATIVLAQSVDIYNALLADTRDPADGRGDAVRALLAVHAAYSDAPAAHANAVLPPVALIAALRAAMAALRDVILATLLDHVRDALLTLDTRDDTASVSFMDHLYFVTRAARAALEDMLGKRTVDARARALDALALCARAMGTEAIDALDALDKQSLDTYFATLARPAMAAAWDVVRTEQQLPQQPAFWRNAIVPVLRGVVATIADNRARVLSSSATPIPPPASLLPAADTVFYVEALTHFSRLVPSDSA